MQRETDFCVECREMSSYSLQKRCVTKNIRGENLTFEITCAVCDTCGGFMSVPGIIDLNVHEIDEQYRKLKGLVSIEDIHTLMELYNIGKAPLSIVLGFGEIIVGASAFKRIFKYHTQCVIVSGIYGTKTVGK